LGRGGGSGGASKTSAVQSGLEGTLQLHTLRGVLPAAAYGCYVCLVGVVRDGLGGFGDCPGHQAVGRRGVAGLLSCGLAHSLVAHYVVFCTTVSAIPCAAFLTALCCDVLTPFLTPLHTPPKHTPTDRVAMQDTTAQTSMSPLS
jgi:hypothetical protein